MEDPELKWYLAYGSNLSTQTFIGRRGIHPLASKNVIVHGLELVFDLSGIPYNEPRFANCRIVNDHSPNKTYLKPEEDWNANDPWTGKGKLIGVAYLLTQSDFARVISTEGGGASYEMVMVDALLLQSQRTLTSYKDDEKDDSNVPKYIKAYTLVAPSSQRPHDGKPSLRYLTIIKEGAKEHNLPNSYIAYLNSLKPYIPSTAAQKVARILFALIWLPIVLVVAFLGMMAGGQYKKNMQLLISFALRNLGIIKEDRIEHSWNDGKINSTHSASLETIKNTLEKVESDVKMTVEATVKSGLRSPSSINAIEKSSLTSIPLTKFELQIREPGQSPEWAIRLSRLVMRCMWYNYDSFWEKVFGDGEGRSDPSAR